jgi:hypothetical protein
MMLTIKRVAMEFGVAFVSADVTMSNGEAVKVIGVADEESNMTWVCEADSRDETLENNILGHVKAAFDAMLTAELEATNGN